MRSATSCGELASCIGTGWSSTLLLAGREAAAPDDDRHAERVRALRHLLADVAVAEQAERAAEQAARLRVLLLVPRAGAQLGDVVGDAAVEREQQRERELGDGDRVLARAVRHVDAALRRGRRRRSCCSRRRRARRARARPLRASAPVTARAAHDEHVGAASSRIAVAQRVVLQIGLIDDVAAGGLQTVDAALLEFVGDENFQSTASLDVTASCTIRRESATRRAASARTRWTSAA